MAYGLQEQVSVSVIKCVRFKHQTYLNLSYLKKINIYVCQKYKQTDIVPLLTLRIPY